MTSAGKAQSRYLLKILSLRRLRLAAELGDLRRFAGHRPLHALLAYAGMDSRGDQLQECIVSRDCRFLTRPHDVTGGAKAMGMC
jgi:hypothetical protein